VSTGGAVVDGAVSDEYRAAVEGLAVFDRSGRARWRVSGRAPRQMLNGILTGTLPAIPKDTPTACGPGWRPITPCSRPRGR
jgi:glycine cleavage system aminomethyltransferase T